MKIYRIAQIEDNNSQDVTAIAAVAKNAGYNSPKLHHSTPSNTFTTFDRSKSKNGFFFSNSPRNKEFGGNIISVYLSYNNPFIDEGDTVLTDKWYNAIEEHGYDAIISQGSGSEFVDETVVFKPEQIKSANPITYDDQGEEIPLSKRFDQNNSDIRY